MAARFALSPCSKHSHSRDASRRSMLMFGRSPRSWPDSCEHGRSMTLAHCFLHIWAVFIASARSLTATRSWSFKASVRLGCEQQPGTYTSLMCRGFCDGCNAKARVPAINRRRPGFLVLITNCMRGPVTKAACGLRRRAWQRLCAYASRALAPSPGLTT